MVGFCNSPWQLIALRGLTGLVHFGGFISVIALGGLVDEESRSEGQSNLSIDCAALPDSSAFSWRAAGSAIGSMSGSALGGLLSEPNGRIPLFSDIKVFQVNPYAAPGVLLLLLSMIASASVILLVKEVSTLTEGTDDRRILVSKKRTASKILQSRWIRPHPRL